MEMKTDRLVIRDFKFEDQVDLFDMCCDVQTARMAGWSPHLTLEDTKSVIAAHICDGETYAIVLKATNSVIGTISLYDRSTIDVTKKELGFCLNKKYRKKGYMIEACKLMVEIAFRSHSHRVDVLTTCHATDNVDSKKLIAKLPFKSQGVMGNYRTLYDNTKVDCEIYTIAKEDY